MRRQSIVVLLAVGVVLRSPAAAQPAAESVSTLPAWEGSEVPGEACVTGRAYADLAALVIMIDRQGRTTLSVSKPGWQLRPGQVYEGSLALDGSLWRLRGFGLHSTSAGGMLFLVDEAYLSRIAEARRLDFAGPGAIRASLDLRGGAAAVAGLRDCAGKAVAARIFASAPPPRVSPPIEGKARRTAPLIPLETLITWRDYPKEARRAGVQGAVGFRLDIDRRGRVASCTVLGSSGSSALDAATCRLLKARARFHPALDAAGKPEADSLVSRILWKLEAPAPAPAKPRS